MDDRLDQFYTKPHVVQACVVHLLHVLNRLGESPTIFIEPSAGSGSFVDALRARNLPVQAYDIAPQFPTTIKRDFLRDRLRPQGCPNSRAIIGNPPFGRRGAQALAFLDRSLQVASTVGFILPRQFTKYGTQKKILTTACLVSQEAIPPQAFFTDDTGSISIGCVFQVWTRGATSLPDLRLRKRPVISHKDFVTYQYNNTKEALKVFERDFDLAIFNQGYGVYPTFRTSAAACDKHKQWLLVKADRKEVLERIKKMDYQALSEGNTTVPGFRKADFVQEYTRLYGS